MSVHANNRSIIHKGDGGVHTAAPPDVCKTPSPGGPVPIPYVNIANSSALAKGTKKVKIEGNPVANAGSNLGTSMGDEPGTAGGGLVSSKFKGKMAWGSTSLDVKCEGKGVARFMDATLQNGNSYNTAFLTMGGTGVAYYDDFEGDCNICGGPPATHRVLELEAFREGFVTPLIQGLPEHDEVMAAYNVENKDDLSIQFTRPPGKRNNGFMIGVALCKDNQRIWAISGKVPHDGIIKYMAAYEADGQRFDLYVNMNTVNADQLMRVNPLMQDVNDPEHQERRRRFNAVWTEAEVNDRQQNPGWTTPGQCAAAKVVASGHVSVSLTEFFFMPRQATREWGETYNWLTTRLVDQERALFATPPPFDLDEGAGDRIRWQTWRDRVLNHFYATTEMPPFAPNVDTVASCHTCQLLLYRAMCNIEDRPCAGRDTVAHTKRDARYGRLMANPEAFRPPPREAPQNT